MNTLDISHIEPLLDDDFRYSSQWMIGEISSKQEFADHIKSWLLSVKQSGSRFYAEIAIIQAWGHNKCIVTAEGEKDKLVATVFAHVKACKRRKNQSGRYV